MVTQGATLSPEELVCVFFERVERNTNEYAVLPYIRGLTEPLKRLLKRYDIKVISKLLRTLNQMLPSPKDRPSEEKQTNAGADPGRGESGSSHGQIFSTLEYFALTFLKILD